MPYAPLYLGTPDSESESGTIICVHGEVLYESLQLYAGFGRQEGLNSIGPEIVRLGLADLSVSKYMQPDDKQLARSVAIGDQISEKSATKGVLVTTGRSFESMEF